jgi:hypothetical protein
MQQNSQDLWLLKAVVLSETQSKTLSRRLVLESPNKSLQRAVTDKVLGRGRPSAERTRALRARVLRGRRAAAELNR